jgi:glutathione S-transferase
VHQWISAVNGYFYPYLIYHRVHERLVFPPLGIEPEEKVVKAALPRIEVALDVLEQALGESGDFLIGKLSLADFFLYPSMFAFNLTVEGQAMLPQRRPAAAWLARMDALDSVRRFRAAMPTPVPIEHARSWATDHRPQYR